jgi:hypothetical protein
MTSASLALWLRLDPAEHAEAILGLVSSGDLLIVPDGDGFGLVRTHANPVSRLEIGIMPVMPATIA